jgi:hypothetical protein
VATTKALELAQLADTIAVNANGEISNIGTLSSLDISGDIDTSALSFTGPPTYTENSLGVYSSGTWLNSPASTHAYLGIGGTGVLKWKSAGVDVLANTTSSSTTTGALTVVGGLGVAENVNAGRLYARGVASSGASPFTVFGTLGNVGINYEGADLFFTRPTASYISANDAAGHFWFRTGGTNRRLVIESDGDIRFTQSANTSLYGFEYTAATSSVDIAGDLSVGGNFLVSGNTTTLNVDTLAIEDLNITLANGAANNTVADGAGITVDGANATLTYVASSDSFSFNKPIIADGNALTNVDLIAVDTAGDLSVQTLKVNASSGDSVSIVSGDNITFDSAPDETKQDMTIRGTSKSLGSNALGISLVQTDAGYNLQSNPNYSNNLVVGQTYNILVNGYTVPRVFYGHLSSSDSTYTTSNIPLDGFVTKDHFSDPTYINVYIGWGSPNGTSSSSQNPSGWYGTGSWIYDGGDLKINAPAVGFQVNVSNSPSITGRTVITGDTASAGGTETLVLANGSGATQLQFGLSENNYAWIQVEDGSTKRDLLLQAEGGEVGIGVTPVSTLDVRSTSALGSVFRRDFNGAVANSANKIAMTIWGQDHDSIVETDQSNIGPMIGFGARLDDASPNTGDVRAGIAYSYNGDLTFHAKSGSTVSNGEYERIRIDGVSGSVGINHNAPVKMLSVNVGSDSDGLFLYSNHTQIGSLSRTTVDSTVVTSLDGNTGRDIHVGGTINTNVILANAGGNVGIANTSPTNKLQIGDTGHSGYALTTMSNVYGAVIQVGESSTPTTAAALWVRNMKDNSDANTTPTTLFRVDGDGQVSQTSDAASGPDWQVYNSVGNNAIRFEGGSNASIYLDGADGDFLGADYGRIYHDGTSLSLGTHGAFNLSLTQNEFIWNTNTNATPFNITRSGATNQALRIAVDDASVNFYSVQDEVDTGNFKFFLGTNADQNTGFSVFGEGSATSLLDVRADGTTNIRGNTTIQNSSLTVDAGISSPRSSLMTGSTENPIYSREDASKWFTWTPSDQMGYATWDFTTDQGIRFHARPSYGNSGYLRVGRGEDAHVLPQGWTGTVSGDVYAWSGNFATSVRIYTKPLSSDTWTIVAQSDASSSLFDGTLSWTNSTALTEPYAVRFYMNQGSGVGDSSSNCRLKNIKITNLSFSQQELSQELKHDQGAAVVERLRQADNFSQPRIRPAKYFKFDFALSKSIGPQVSFTRSGTATYFDEYRNLVTASTNAPRFQHDPLTGECKGLLMEHTSTNSITGSDTGGFSVVRGTRGSSTTKRNIAGYLYSDSTGDPNINLNYSVSTDTYWAFSTYVDVTGLGLSSGSRSLRVVLGSNGNASNGTSVRFYFTDPNVTGDYDTVSQDAASENTSYVTSGSTRTRAEYIGDNIWRLSVGVDYNTVISAVFPVIYFGTGASNVWIGGTQLEINKYYPTSLIPTTGVALTRGSETATMAGIDGHIDTSKAFTAYYEHIPYADPAVNINSHCWALTGNYFLFFYGINPSSATGACGHANRVSSGYTYAVSTSVNSHTLNKYAVRLKPNDGTGTLNGGIINTDTSFTVNTQTSLNIGRGPGSNEFYNGIIRSIRLYGGALSDAELKELTEQ